MELQSSHEQRGAAMSDSEIIRKLWSFVVPTDKPEFRTRVGISMAFLVASKGLNVAVSPTHCLATICLLVDFSKAYAHLDMQLQSLISAYRGLLTYLRPCIVDCA